MMELTKQQIEEYREQGFVKLEGVLDESWIALLQRAIERVENEADKRPRVANMSAMKEMADAGQRPRIDGPVRREGRSDYLVAHNAWDWNDELRQVAFESPLAGLSAQLMAATQIRFYFDQTFVKPAGSMISAMLASTCQIGHIFNNRLHALPLRRSWERAGLLSSACQRIF